MFKKVVLGLLACFAAGAVIAQSNEMKGEAMIKKEFKKKAPNKQAVIETTLGKITIEILDGAAPVTAANFIKQIKAKTFDGTTFHRIVPDFVIQGGDILSKDDNPYNDGTGGGQIGVDKRVLSNVRGSISMASSSRAKPIEHQSDIQFFINIRDNVFLDDMGFIPFAKVVEGMDVVDEIVKQPRDGNDRPLTNITMKSVKIITVK